MQFSHKLYAVHTNDVILDHNFLDERTKHEQNPFFLIFLIKSVHVFRNFERKGGTWVRSFEMLEKILNF